MIHACLASLLAQDYPDFDLTVIDDGSTDATPQLLAEWSQRDPRVRVHRVERLPHGWAGKAYALHSGVMLTSGAWLLFTDADTRHSPQTLRLMIGHALRQYDDLLTMRTTLMTMSGAAMPLLMPTSDILLAGRVIASEVSDPAHPRAFAFGQYILLQREAYVATGGYTAEGVRSTFIDDLALAELFKRNGLRVEVVNGRGLVANRQWRTWRSARRGWVKSTHGELLRSHIPFAALPAALALIAYGLGPSSTLVYALHEKKLWRLSTLLAGVTLAAQIDTKRRVDREYELPLPWSLAAPAGWVACGLLVLDVARLVLTGQGADWKGRHSPE
jgi:chlorobactene glucosyltransferase